MKKAASLLVCLVTAIQINAATITVNNEGGQDFNNLQPAIDAAASGDTILVHPYCYRESIIIQNKDITITSLDPDNPDIVERTIIDAGGADRAVTIKNSNIAIMGMTIQNGYVDEYADFPVGGGIHGESGSLELVNSTIKDNFAYDYGGGIYCSETILIMKRCSVVGNKVWRRGGGGLCGGYIGSSMTDCIFEGNEVSTGDGGGILSFGGPIKNCRIINNHITWEGLWRGGGGLASCKGPVIGCLIAHNSVEFRGGGGGIAHCEGLIKDCVIVNNIAWGTAIIPLAVGGE